MLLYILILCAPIPCSGGNAPITASAGDGSLADAAATLACNFVKQPDDIEPVLTRVMAIPGILGDLIAEAGKLPEIIRNRDLSANSKIMCDPWSHYNIY